MQLHKPSEEDETPSQSWRLLSRASIVFYTIDLDGSIYSVDEPVEALFGYTPSELVGRNLREFIGPRRSFATAELQFQAQVAGESEIAVCELEVLAKERHLVPVLVTTVPIQSPQGAILGVRGMVHAIGDPRAGRLARRPSRKPRRPVAALTPRQGEVLRLLGQGLSTSEIARMLGISEETARHHIRAILRSLGAHSRLEAVVQALRLGLIKVA